MNKLITIILATACLLAVSSCAPRKKDSPNQSQSMPGMSAGDHAKMKKDAMPGMKM